MALVTNLLAARELCRYIASNNAFKLEGSVQGALSFGQAFLNEGIIESGETFVRVQATDSAAEFDIWRVRFDRILNRLTIVGTGPEASTISGGVDWDDGALLEVMAIVDTKGMNHREHNKWAFHATSNSNQMSNDDGSSDFINFGVVTQEGGHFSVSDGEFTVPSDSWCSFSASLSVTGGNGLDDSSVWGFCVNGTRRLSVASNFRLTTDGTEQITTFDVRLKLNKDDKIRVGYAGVNYSIKFMSWRCHFSGNFLF